MYILRGISPPFCAGRPPRKSVKLDLYHWHNININYISVYNTNFSYSKNWTYPPLVQCKGDISPFCAGRPPMKSVKLDLYHWHNININYISVYNTNFSYSKNWTYPPLVQCAIHRTKFLSYKVQEVQECPRHGLVNSYRN